jgi:hypothetical protein
MMKGRMSEAGIEGVAELAGATDGVGVEEVWGAMLCYAVEEAANDADGSA